MAKIVVFTSVLERQARDVSRLGGLGSFAPERRRRLVSAFVSRQVLSFIPEKNLVRGRSTQLIFSRSP